jgi:glycosyltransferase involved in cell wall biosynthesis
MQKMDELTRQAVEQQMKLATTWQTLGRFSHAIASCKKVIELQPDYLPAYLTLTALLSQSGQREQAIEAYREAIEVQTARLVKSNESDWDTVRGRTDAKEPLHIVLYTNCPGTYGAEQVSHALMIRLATVGYKVTCVQSQAEHHLIQAREALGIHHVWLNGDAYQFGYTISNISEVADIFANLRPDLIIFADGNPMDNLAANCVALHLGIPYIRVIHCVIPSWARDFAAYLCLLPDIFKSARAIVSVSQANLKLMQEQFGLPENLAHVIYNGRPDEYFVKRQSKVRDRLRQTLSIPQDAIVVFTAARMYPVKGYQHQVNAIKKLQHTSIWSKLYFVWAGTGNLETQLKADVELLGISQQVKFLGERADVPDLLDAADIFLLPSHVEGMPLSVMEAMAKGLPVAATGVSGIPEQLGETGQILPDPNLDPDATVRAIAETIQAWAEDADLRERIGQACRKRAVMMFREEQMLDCYMNLIQQVIDSLSENP